MKIQNTLVIFYIIAIMGLSLRSSPAKGFSLKLGDYILVKIPSKSEQLKPTDITTYPAKVFKKEGKIHIYVENTDDPIVNKNSKHPFQFDGGVYELVTGSAWPDVLFFRSIDAGEADHPNPDYLGSVYRGSHVGGAIRGFFIEGHNSGIRGIFLLIKTSLSADSKALAPPLDSKNATSSSSSKEK